jgi:hypothetical protein
MAMRIVLKISSSAVMSSAAATTRMMPVRNSLNFWMRRMVSVADTTSRTPALSL